MIFSTAFLGLFLLNIFGIVSVLVLFCCAVLLIVIGLAKLKNDNQRIVVGVSTFLTVLILMLAYGMTVHALR